MLERLRSRSNDESGFTLVELLVVMLIIGILAAIAIPSFFSQRDKATDSDAKSAARTAQTSIETYATDNDGSYVGARRRPTWRTSRRRSTPASSAVDLRPPYDLHGHRDLRHREHVLDRAGVPPATPSLTCTGDSGGCNNGRW